MKRIIVGFGVDEAGDYVAELDCGHRQHVRHNPPLSEREWVLTADGRNGKLGESLNCVRCERLEMPEGVVAFQQTAVFTEETIPAGLQKDHATGAGVWAKIIVLEGKLRYQAEALGVDMELAPDVLGVIVPQVVHAVAPVGPVRFFVEFYRLDDGE
jgi:tellurite resistance-related uncharacterized protein